MFAYQALEFNLILNEISNYAFAELTKKKVKDLKPLFDLKEIKDSQNKISEAIKIASRSGNLPFLTDFDIVEILGLVKSERNLKVTDLQFLRLFLKMSLDIKDRSSKFNSENIVLVYLKNHFLNIDPVLDIINILDSTIAPDGYILDSASDKLYKIRKDINRIKVRRDKVLNDLLIKRKKLLNDNILVMRNDRYCLPVNTDLKKQVKGVIHDVSASGTTTYIEPFEANELSNEIVRLNKDEELEIERILREISTFIFPYYDVLKLNMDLLLDLDFYFSNALYSIKYECHKPQINDLGNVNLINARHPLIDIDEVVPVNIKINEIKPVLMITGPNTGGKTVALKTLGLLSLMSQSGLLIPASDKSEISIFSGVFADIGDKQSIKQSLSTFSSHIKNVNEIINKADELSLILLDELGSGTDPNEGTSLAMSIVDYFLTKNVRLVLTTHYSELKIYAYTTPEILNASVKFDINTLKPLYEIEYGKSGSSNALLIAERLGLNKDILKKAEGYLTEQQTDLSESIHTFEEKIVELEEKISSITETEQNIKLKEQELNLKLLNFEKEKEKAFIKAEQEAKRQLEVINEKALSILNKLESSPKEHEVAELKHDLSKLGIKRDKKENLEDLNINDHVYIIPYKQEGTIINIKKDLYLVKFGIFELEFKKPDLKKIARKTKTQESRPKPHTPRIKTATQATNELDLRGKRFEQVSELYKRFIDQALLANLSEVKVIHGFGTGAVRKALYQELKNDPHIKSYRYGGEFEGMAGVTIITLA